MLCVECDSIDLGEAIPTGSEGTCAQWDGSPPQRTHASEGPGDRRYISSMLPHGKTFAEMKRSATGGCELCGLVVAEYRQRKWAPAPDTVMFRSVQSAHASDQLFSTRTPRRLMYLIFCEDMSTFTESLAPSRPPGRRTVKAELFVDHEHALANSGDIEYRPAHAANDSKVVRRWLDECRSTHQWCRRANRAMPTRVIDTEPWKDSEYVRVVNCSNCQGDYAALSHCWGSSLTNKTTTALLASHARGIRTSSLCRTFREAIHVTRSLGLRYLWVDALCIIQDDPDDWKREAEKMVDVYSNASVTLAATASLDGTGGLFHSRPATGIGSILKWTRLGCPAPEGVQFRTASKQKVFQEEVLEAPLSRRGWVMQERTLSTRIIHFAKGQLFWECQECTLSETQVPCVETSGVAAKPVTLLAQGPRTKHAWDQAEMDSVWQEIVRDYTACRLTYESDKLIAIAGIAKAWAASCGDRYVAGLWQSTLPVSLAWDVRHSNAASPTARLPFPTWSWASSSSQIAWNPYRHGASVDEEQCESMVEDLQVSVNGSLDSSFFSQVLDGVLTLTGYITYTSLETVTDPVFKAHVGQLRGTTWMRMKNPQTALQDIHAGPPESGPMGSLDDISTIPYTPIPMLLLFRVTRKATDGAGVRCEDHVMLLEPQQEHGHYQRIGIGRIPWCPDNTMSDAEPHQTSWFRDADKARVTIS